MNSMPNVRTVVEKCCETRVCSFNMVALNYKCYERGILLLHVGRISFTSYST